VSRHALIADLLWRPVAWLVTRPGITRRILQRAARTPYNDIYGDDGTLYMRRWWLFNPYPGETSGDGLPRFPLLPSVRVHHIVRADRDRNQHDHPWDARTIILDGCYVEERGKAVHARVRGSTAAIRHNEFHTITYVSPVLGAVTLFITWRYRHTWGFKVPYREYLGLPQR
jgi:hypothetical protein